MKGSVRKRTARLTTVLVSLAVLVTLGTIPRTVSAAINEWTSLGLQGVKVSALAIDPDNPLTIYAGTDGTGVQFNSPGTGVHVFKSTDGGVTWNEASHGLPTPPAADDGYPRQARVTVLKIDPSRPTTLYAGIYSVYFAPGLVSDTPSVFKSTDGGASWNAADSGLPADVFKWGIALAMDPEDPNVLYVASGGSDRAGVSFQVFKTVDGGTTWNRTAGSALVKSDYLLYGYHAFLAVDSHNSGTVYLGLYGAGIFKSTDGGTTWSAAITGPLVPSSNTYRGMEYALMAVSVIAVDPQSPDVIYAGTDNFCTCWDEPNPSGLWKSSDGGRTWAAAKTGFFSYNPNEYYPLDMLVIHPKSAGTLYAAGSGGPFKSTNGGDNWTQLNQGLISGVKSMALTSVDASVLYVGTYRGGVFRITDEIPFLSLVSEYCQTSSWRIHLSNGVPNTIIRLLGTSQGQPWEIAEWGRTDADGSYSEAGAFGEGAIGSYTLKVDVGSALSNTVSFVVSDCRPGRL